MMQSTAIKGNREGQYDVRPAPPFNWDSQLHEFVRSLLSREIRVTRRKVGSRGHLTTCNDRTALAFGTERPRDVGETFHMHRIRKREEERCAGSGLFFCLSRTVSPRSLGPDLVLPFVPFPLSLPSASALLFSHHGRWTAVRELPLFVGRRPAQAGGFSMISNPFRCAYARDRPEPNALKQSPVDCPLNGILAYLHSYKTED